MEQKTKTTEKTPNRFHLSPCSNYPDLDIYRRA